MNDSQNSPIFTAIEIGTENIKILVAHAEKNGELEIIGHTCIRSNTPAADKEIEYQANNVRKGEPRTIKQLEKLLEEAFNEIQCQTHLELQNSNVYVGVTGSQFSTVNDEAEIRITSQDLRITEEDVEKVTKDAREIGHSRRRGTILCTYTRYYLLDDGRKLSNVSGLISSKLKVFLQSVVATDENHLLAPRLLYDVLGCKALPVYTAMALPFGCIDPNTMRDGCLLIDIGAGVTSYCLTSTAGFLHTGHLPVGCNHIENDLMCALDIQWATARKIIRKLNTELNGAAFATDCPTSVMNADDGNQRKAIVEERPGNRQYSVTMSSIEKVIAIRLREIFRMVRDDLSIRHVWAHVNGEILLSGGVALIPGVMELAGEVLGHEVRVAKPLRLFNAPSEILEDSRYIVPLGILQFGVIDKNISQMVKQSKKITSWPFIKRVLKTLLNW